MGPGAQRKIRGGATSCRQVLSAVVVLSVSVWRAMEC